MQGLRLLPHGGVRLELTPTTTSPLSLDVAETAETRIRRLTSENPVIIFSRSSCCMCLVMKRLLSTIGAHPTVIELDEDEIPALNTTAVVGSPALYVGGACVGGLESMVALHLSNSLVPMLVEVGALRKEFLVRCCHGALPFADSLARRGVIIDDSCPFCTSGPNSAIHLFFGCDFACDIWARVGFLQYISATQHHNAPSRFFALLGHKDVDSELFSVICYLIWYYRNRAIFEGVEIDEELIHKSAATIVSDFRNAKGWPEKSAATLGSRLWLKPPRSGIRVYFDGALSFLPAGGTGVFIADESGSFLHGASKFHHGITCPQVIEMLALRDALFLACSLGFTSFACLGDSQLTVLAVLEEVDEPLRCSPILADIRSLLLQIDFLGIFWIRRSENFVAHEFAFKAKNSINCNDTWSSVPEGILSIRAG